MNRDEAIGKKDPAVVQNGQGSGVKFLTKEEREKLALQKLEERKRQQEEIRKQQEEKRKQFLQKAQETERGGSRDNKESSRNRGEGRRDSTRRNEDNRGKDRRSGSKRGSSSRRSRSRSKSRSRSRSRSRENESRRSSRSGRRQRTEDRHSFRRRDERSHRNRSRSRDRESSRSRSRSPERGDREDREDRHYPNGQHPEAHNGNAERNGTEGASSISNSRETTTGQTNTTGQSKVNKERLTPQESGAATVQQLLQKKHAGASSRSTETIEYPTYLGGKGDMYAEQRSDRERQIEDIRNSYLGQKKSQKKNLVKPSDKFARIFKFEWGSEEDTTDETNPLNSEANNNSLLFGRGYLAGVDVREQRNKMSQKFLDALAERRKQEAERLKHVAEEPEVQDPSTQVGELDVVKQRQQKAMNEKARMEMGGGEGLHWSEKPLKNMTERDWRIFREDFDIRVRGGKVPHPLRFWNEGNFSSLILDAINEKKYKDPSPIQRQAIPVGLEQRDIIGVAETGSGKTAAFVVPLLHYVLQMPHSARSVVSTEGPLALVMAPTRELALQIEDETKSLSQFTDIQCCSIVGGTSMQPQIQNLRRGVDVVIGTPGRIIDCLENGYMVLNQCRYIVLDEADRMVDMGFEPQVTAVLERMGGTKEDDEEGDELMEDNNSAENNDQQLESAEGNQTDGKKVSLWKRTTIMYSATMPPEVEKLANKFLHQPVTLKIGDEDSGKNKRIIQEVKKATEQEKPKLLQNALQKCPKPVIVFVNAKSNCGSVATHCERAGFKPVVLHGGKKQDEREKALQEFKDGKSQVLVATDVAGRGLDIPDVAQIINFDLPQEIERYTHRIGRTGRAGKEGRALSFFTEDDSKILYHLRQQLISTDNEVPNDLAKHPSAQAPPGAAGGQQNFGTADE